MEATPVTLPLPGGSEGATVRVHPLLTAMQPSPPSLWRRPSGPAGMVRGYLTARRSSYVEVPCPAFLVEHVSAGPFLIDTGYGPLAASDPGGHLGRLLALGPKVRTEPGWDVASQVRARGRDPEAIDLVVMTHLHFDHTSGISALPDAAYLVDAAEFEAGRSGKAWEGYHPPLLEAAREWQTYSDDGDADLFGDSSVVLLATHGHTAGHRSVALRTRSGPLLLTGDAAYATRNLDDPALPLFTWRDDAYLEARERLVAWREANPGAPVVCGHDPWAWEGLPEIFE